MKALFILVWICTIHSVTPIQAQHFRFDVTSVTHRSHINGYAHTDERSGEYLLVNATIIELYNKSGVLARTFRATRGNSYAFNGYFHPATYGNRNYCSISLGNVIHFSYIKIRYPGLSTTLTYHGNWQ